MSPVVFILLAAMLQMVSNPQQFEVMVMPNLYGNIIANIGTGLVGGPGTTAGANIGTRCAVFEQVSKYLITHYIRQHTNLI